jgi:hypothetical protein
MRDLGSKTCSKDPQRAKQTAADSARQSRSSSQLGELGIIAQPESAVFESDLSPVSRIRAKNAENSRLAARLWDRDAFDTQRIPQESCKFQKILRSICVPKPRSRGNRGRRWDQKPSHFNPTRLPFPIDSTKRRIGGISTRLGSLPAGRIMHHRQSAMPMHQWLRRSRRAGRTPDR